MKVMLIEDNQSKILEISSYIIECGVLKEDIIFVKSMTDFAANLNAEISLFIIDFFLPNSDSSDPCLNGRAILESIIKAGKHDALLIAISSYPAEFPNLREVYESRGCILADFSQKASWKETLKYLLKQIKNKLTFDFIIFCALQEERNPYIAISNGKRVMRSGIDCFDLEVAGKRGTVVLLPNMGLVNAAVTVSVCIDRFKPRLVCMSGICGGFKGRAELGQLLISSMVYEYQSGKWAKDGFKQEPYQVATDHITLSSVKSLLSESDLITELEKGYTGSRPSKAVAPDIGIFTSGSAVVADVKHLQQIESIHRKVNALDMEVYAVQRAAELASIKPLCICAKTVVDLCDSNKSDSLHAYGSYISAKFVLKAISNFYS